LTDPRPQPRNGYLCEKKSNLKGSVGLILAKVSVMRVTIPIDSSTCPFIPLPRCLTPPQKKRQNFFFPAVGGVGGPDGASSVDMGGGRAEGGNAQDSRLCRARHGPTPYNGQDIRLRHSGGTKRRNRMQTTVQFRSSWPSPRRLHYSW
jgi:hypothetical protein